MAPYYEAEGVTLFHGNALAVLSGMAHGTVDALITDPPYSSGGATRGDRAAKPSAKYQQSGQKERWSEFDGDNRDQRGFLHWCALWMAEALRVARPGAPACVFTDWRQLPVTTDALQAGGWVWRGIVPWNKTEGVRPQMGRFRAQCEYVVWGSSGPMPQRPDVGVLPGFFQRAVRAADKFHMTGKPVEVMREIVRIVPPGGTVLDPFSGGGTTLVAALLEGRRAIGIEINESHCETTAKRLEALRAGSEAA